MKDRGRNKDRYDKHFRGKVSPNEMLFTGSINKQIHGHIYYSLPTIADLNHLLCYQIHLKDLRNLQVQLIF